MRMAKSRWIWVLGGLLLLGLMIRCGSNPGSPPVKEAQRPDAGASVTPAPAPEEPAPPEAQVAFQTGFALALRESESVSSVTTFRVLLPVELAGDQVKVTFKAGRGGMSLLRAFVSTEASPQPVPLPLPPEASDVTALARVTSLPAAIAVDRGMPLEVTFEVRGSVATSGIRDLPGGSQAPGAVANREGSIGGVARDRAAAVVAVEIEAPVGPVLVALGDSITEGYVNGVDDDVRRGWAHVAALELGVPVLNAGVSSQGVKLAQEHLDEEVLSLPGITDCIVFLGTNDLHAFTAPALSEQLEAIFDRLRPHCRVWAATLLPKERTSAGSLAEIEARRVALNTWLRTEAPVEGVLDFEAALRGQDAHHFAPGMGEDGIHPSRAGQARLGKAAADYFREHLPWPPP